MPSPTFFETQIGHAIQTDPLCWTGAVKPTSFLASVVTTEAADGYKFSDPVDQTDAGCASNAGTGADHAPTTAA
jgi:hypothetical protein